MLVYGRRNALDNIAIAAPHGFVDPRIDLAVREIGRIAFAKLHVKLAGYPFGQILVGITGEYPWRAVHIGIYAAQPEYGRFADAVHLNRLL
jgi:hypothetical protein